MAFRLTFSALTCFASCVAISSAQDVPQFQIVEPQIADGEAQVDLNNPIPKRVLLERATDAATLQEQFWRKELDLQIKDLDAIVKLTAAQKKKLQLARKGAVSRAVDKWKELQNQKTPTNNEVFLGDQVVLNLQRFPGGFQGGANTQILPHKEPIWVKALDKVLTNEQKEKLEKHRRQQRQLRRKLAVDEYVVNMDHHLKLSSVQRKELSKLVDKTHGNKLDQKGDANSGFAQVLQLPALPNDKLQKILTENQMLKYQQLGGNWARFLVLPKADLPKRPILGVHLMLDDRGVVIRGVIPGSPADRAGILAGDVVKTIDAKAVRSIQEAITAIQKKGAGQDVVLSNLRDNKPMKITATLMRHQDILLND